MADDQGNDDDADGQRKDGKPYKRGNTREDGSYDVGKSRPPAEHKFKAGDGRMRGRRKKGGKNSDTVWRNQLSKKMTIDGRTQTAFEWNVEGTIRRGIKNSDRASETVFERAEGLEAAKERKLGLTDSEVLDSWFAQRISDVVGSTSDDDDIGDGTGDLQTGESDDVDQ